MVFVKRKLYPCTETTKHWLLMWSLQDQPTVWDSCRQEKIVSIEAVQPCAARFITRDYNRTSDTEMIRSLDLDQLEHGRKFHQLSIFYLALNNSIALAIPNYFSPKQRLTRSSFNNSFIPPSCNNDYHLYSFFQEQ